MKLIVEEKDRLVIYFKEAVNQVQYLKFSRQVSAAIQTTRKSEVLIVHSNSSRCRAQVNNLISLNKRFKEIYTSNNEHGCV